jgi:phosphatidylglycerol:prolipoprotein diacylglycerol transferase
VMIAMWWFVRSRAQPFGSVLDFVAPIVPLGLGFGRIGNFIGQELWGRPTDLSWGMVFPRDPSGLARHPSQLYQAFLEGVLLFAVVWWFSSRPRPRWAVGGVFISVYGLFRILVEFVREPDAGIGFVAFGWLTRGQLYSLPMLIGGIALVAWAYRREAKAGATA